MLLLPRCLQVTAAGSEGAGRAETRECVLFGPYFSVCSPDLAPSVAELISDEGDVNTKFRVTKRRMQKLIKRNGFWSRCCVAAATGCKSSTS